MHFGGPLKLLEGDGLEGMGLGGAGDSSEGAGEEGTDVGDILK